MAARLSGSSPSVFLRATHPERCHNRGRIPKQKAGNGVPSGKRSSLSFVASDQTMHFAYRRSSAKDPLTFFVQVYRPLFDLLGFLVNLLPYIDGNLSNYIPPAPVRSGAVIGISAHRAINAARRQIEEFQLVGVSFQLSRKPQPAILQSNALRFPNNRKCLYLHSQRNPTDFQETIPSYTC
jgi:hypothetical protein